MTETVAIILYVIWAVGIWVTCGLMIVIQDKDKPFTTGAIVLWCLIWPSLILLGIGAVLGALLNRAAERKEHDHAD